MNNAWFFNYFAPYLKRNNRIPLKGEAALCVDFNQALMTLKIEGKLKGLYFHIAHETGGSDRRAFGHVLKLMGKFNGVADYVFLRNNCVLMLEAKTKGNKQSEHQHLFAQWCAHEGIPYSVIYSAQEGLDRLREHGFLERDCNEEMDSRCGD